MWSFVNGQCGAQEQQPHRMSCGPFSLNYGQEAEGAAVSHGPGVRSRTRRCAAISPAHMLTVCRHVCSPTNVFQVSTVTEVTQLCNNLLHQQLPASLLHLD